VNVLLIVADSLRAASLDAGLRTPFFDGLRRRGLWFRRAYATECWTLPTHASMFTGQLPSQHRAHFRTMELAAGPSTVAERLAARGYHTELVTRNFVFDGTIAGIARGFQVSTRPLAELTHATATTWLLALAKPRVRRHVRATGFFHPRHAEQRAFVRTFARSLLPADDLTLAHALDVMRRCRRRAQPFFVCCNLYDVHAPYAPSAHSLWEPWRSPRGAAANLALPYYMSKLGGHAYLREGFTIPDWARRALLRRYELAIEHVDALLGAFAATAESERLLDDTIVIITSDHGEAFGEHGLYLHDASVHDTHLHVPLSIQHPRRAAAVVDDVVSTRDLHAVALPLPASRADGRPVPPGSERGGGRQRQVHLRPRRADARRPRPRPSGDQSAAGVSCAAPAGLPRSRADHRAGGGCGAPSGAPGRRVRHSNGASEGRVRRGRRMCLRLLGARGPAALLAVCLATIGAASAAPGEMLEVLLDMDAHGIRVQSLTPRDGSPPRRRVTAAGADEWLVEALDHGGNVAFTTVAPDPRRGRADWPADGANGAAVLAGEDVSLEAASVAVQIPRDTSIAALRLRNAEGATLSTELPAAGASLRRGDVVAPPWDAFTLVDNGDAANRVDLVFVGDGYLNEDLATTYHAQIERIAALWFSEPPFDVYARYFNIHVVDVISRERGSDSPQAMITRDTALDTTLSLGGTRCAYTTSPRKVLDAAALAPAADVILILINEPQIAGCGLQFAVATGVDPNILVHEFGHTYGKLGDEYGGSGRLRGGDPGKPNLTLQTTRGRIPWHLWLPDGIMLPTLDPNAGVPAGLYEGGGFYDSGIYRPTFTSKMRTNSGPWGAVNAEVLLEETYERVDPIDDHQPPESLVNLASGARTFAIQPIDTAIESLAVSWRLDDRPVGSGITLTVGPELVPAGGESHLTVLLRDDSPFVRDPAGRALLESTRTWRVINREPSGCAADCDANGTVAIEELIAAVGVALGGLLAQCDAADTDLDQRVSVYELIRAVRAALDGCTAD